MHKTFVANELEAYVDDIRIIGFSEESCRLAGARTSKIFQYLGQQDAARKYRPPFKVPGPWCGSFVACFREAVWIYVSQAKWDKVREFIATLNTILEEGDDAEIDFKFLEQCACSSQQ